MAAATAAAVAAAEAAVTDAEDAAAAAEECGARMCDRGRLLALCFADEEVARPGVRSEPELPDATDRVAVPPALTLL